MSVYAFVPGVRKSTPSEALPVKDVMGRRRCLGDITNGARPNSPPVARPPVVRTYALEGKIGHGSFGVVYHARTSKGQRVALKRIHVAGVPSSELLAVIREIQTLRTNVHPSIVKLIDCELLPASLTVHIIMEHVETDLAQVFRNKQLCNRISNHWTSEHSNFVLYQLLSALQHMHSHGIAHRDLKTNNILVRRSDVQIKVCDFGLARWMPKSCEDLMGRTAAELPIAHALTRMQISRPTHQLTRHVVTRWYRAPEVVLQLRYGLPVDLWAVGCVFGECLGAAEGWPAPLFQGRASAMSNGHVVGYDEDEEEGSMLAVAAELETKEGYQLDHVFKLMGKCTSEKLCNLVAVSNWRSSTQVLPARRSERA
jgi:serine/threonine protein kinase